MNCPNCKNPIQENASECEWCNFVLNEQLQMQMKGDILLIIKGECLFFSKRIKRTKCFYEIFKDGIKIFDGDDKINVYIKREIIFNIENYRPFRWLHFIPVIGSLIWMAIIGFSKFRKGFSIVTSKSGKNIIVVKNINYQTFNSTISSYIKNQ